MTKLEDEARRGVELDLVGPGDEAALQAVFEGAADYFERLTGKSAVDADAAAREIRSASETAGREAAIIRAAGEPVGAVGWWAGSPEPDFALLGMLLVVKPRRRRGHAAAGLRLLESRLAASGIVRVRTGVAADDGLAQRFLEAVGFASMDQRTHVDMDGGRLRIAFYEKEL